MQTQTMETKPTAKKQRPKGLRYKSSKLDRDKVQSLAEQGLTATDIAKHQDVAVSTVCRYLNSIKPLKEQIKGFTENHADILALSQLKKQAIEDIVVESWIQREDEIKSLDVRTQKDLLHTIQGGKYYDHQSERLERGQSTQNVTHLHGVIRELQRKEQVIDVSDNTNTMLVPENTESVSDCND